MTRASALRGYSTLMHRLGVDPAPLMKRHGLPADAGEDEDALVPLRAAVNLLEESAALTGRHDLGLQMAASQDIGILGPLAAAMQHSSTVGDALNTASRYLFMQSPALQLDVLKRSSLVRGAVELRFDIVLPRLSLRRQGIDQSLGTLHRILRFLAGSRYELRAVSLPHAPLVARGVYQRFFGAVIHSEEAHAGLHMSPATLNCSLAAVNETLRRIAMDYLNRHYSHPGESVSERVRRALASTLTASGGSKTVVAAQLFLHPRTLQRKLALEGTQFEQLRDEVRQQIALRYLRETEVPLSQLASLLGLASQSVLCQSCRRWFNQAPSAIRAASARRR